MNEANVQRIRDVSWAKAEMKYISDLHSYMIQCNLFLT